MAQPIRSQCISLSLLLSRVSIVQSKMAPKRGVWSLSNEFKMTIQDGAQKRGVVIE